VRLRLAHVSMQFSDSKRQMEQDATRIFERARSFEYAWLTGTEAGPANPLRDVIGAEAREAGYRFAVREGNDSWIAVNRDLIDGGYGTFYAKVLDRHEGVGRHSERGVLGVEFDNERLGHLSVLATHYLTKGRDGMPNEDENRQLARTIGRIAREKGRGRALVFYGGDQNIVDRTDDTFMGAPLTSAWDETGTYERTGHGNIDVIASFDPDSRVKAISCRALDDREFHLHTDHFMVEAVYEVAPLPRKARA
jgi:hypothetical protein